jgi:hypothetical protein
MPKLATTLLNNQLELADILLERRSQMFSTQDLPGRYGEVVNAFQVRFARHHSTQQTYGSHFL